MISVANTANTNTFEYWITRTNELANHMSKAVVTTDGSGNTNVTTGNAIITGCFTSNTLAIGNSSSNVIISTPNSVQKSAGSYYLNANGSFIEPPIKKLSNTTNSTSAKLIDSFSTSDFNSVEYLISVVDNTNSNFISTKLHLLNYNSDVLQTEYGKLISNNDIVTFTSNISSSTVRLYITPTISNTTIKMVRISN